MKKNTHDIPTIVWTLIILILVVCAAWMNQGGVP